jgi:hypothetical protein
MDGPQTDADDPSLADGGEPDQTVFAFIHRDQDFNSTALDESGRPEETQTNDLCLDGGGSTNRDPSARDDEGGQQTLTGEEGCLGLGMLRQNPGFPIAVDLATTSLVPGLTGTIETSCIPDGPNGVRHRSRQAPKSTLRRGRRKA